MGQISFWSVMIQLIYCAKIHTVKKNKEGLLFGSKVVGDEVNTEKSLSSYVADRT
jgi:hypothetical protein